MKKDLAIRLSHRDIIFESEDYIAINKKRGWPVHQTLDPKRPDLFSALKAYLKNRAHGQEIYLALLHRLDVMTSGIVVFSKSTRANKVLTDVFENRQGTKIYRALCLNTLSQTNGEWVDFLQKSKINSIEQMIKVEKGGQKAITHFRQLGEYCQKRFCQLELQLVTGRMHQIRVQAKLAGTPLLGDDLYGDKQVNKQLNCHQQLLHAYSLEFFDPLSNKTLHLEAPLPSDFLEWEKRLESEKLESKPQVKEFHYLLFHKPYNVLCQFTTNNADELTLADFNLPSDIYPVGRLDKDSEGLLLLTDDGQTKDRLANPKFEKEKSYWVQVEGTPSSQSIERLKKGIDLKDFITRRCHVRLLTDAEIETISERNPPIRQRMNIPTSWLEMIITEGKNRQIRRMTAAVGHPTLRLIRVAMDGHKLGDLTPGSFKIINSF